MSFKLNIPALQKSENVQKVMLSLDLNKIEQEDKEDDANGIPPRFGFPHEVSFNLDNSGEWTVLPDGSRIWRLVISCPGALSINLLYDKFRLPDGAKFFIYSSDRKHSIGAFTSVNNKGDDKNIQGFATGLVYGEQITLEYYVPNDVKEVGIISVAYVVHGYRYISLWDDEKNINQYGTSRNCNINVNCPEGNNWQLEKNAVAKILMNGTRLCTGSLINTTANDNRPLFLTADHCMGGLDAITDNSPALPYWIFYWQFESPTCVSSVPPEYSTNAAQLVSNNSISDFALLQLTEDPRNATGVIPYYLGWDRSGNAGIGGVGVHHPRGDIKKITPYTITPQSTNYLNNTVNMNGNHWRVTWSSGTTEGGSSGSPLINNNHRVIGQLHGGYASCNAQTQPDWYGKFSVSWTGNGATDNRRKLQPWLDPLGTNPQTLDGIALAISGNNSLFTFQNVTYSIATIPANTTVTWNVPNNFTIVNGQGTNQITVRACSGYNATITATLSGATNQILTKDVWLINGELTATSYNTHIEATFTHPYAQCYDWEWEYSPNFTYGTNPGIINCTSQSTLELTPKNGTTGGYIKARAKSGSCISPWQHVYDAHIWNWQPELTGYFNPVSGEPFYAGLVEEVPNYASHGNIEYHWYFGNELFEVTYESSIQSYDWPCGDHMFRVVVKADNKEASTETDFWGMCTGSRSSVYSAAYPNPASTALTIDKIEETDNNIEIQSNIKAEKPTTVKVLLYSHSTTKLVFSKDYSSEEKQIKIDTSKLPAGVYYLNIIENGETIKEQTVIIGH